VRSTTLSLGSIAFGSLIVTILELLRIAAQMLHNSQMQGGDCELGVLEGRRLARGVGTWLTWQWSGRSCRAA
jgi:hypothetical protein